jgi:hypothetical protein
VDRLVGILKEAEESNFSRVSNGIIGCFIHFDVGVAVEQNASNNLLDGVL